MAVISEKKVKDSLVNQLSEKGIETDYNLSLIDDYMKHWKIVADLNKDIKKDFNNKDINEYLIKKNSNNSDDESDSGGSNPYFNYAPSNKIIQQVNEFNKTNVDKKIDIKQNKNENKDNKFKENTNLMKMYAAENLNNNNEAEFYI